MPAKAPLTSIECISLSHLLDELASVQDALSITETEETWDNISRTLTHFAALCNGNGSTYPTDIVAALRSSARPINSALNSERTRLSGTATEFISTAVNALGRAFEPLVPHYLPALLTLCTRANKVFINRAKECIHAVIEHTQSPSILHHLAVSVTDKSVTLRLAAAEAVVLCLNSFNPPDLEKEQRAKEIEAIIKSTAVDANADVRKVGRKIFDAYKILLPGRVPSFTAPLTPTIRKYLDIKGTTTAATRSQPPSRPTSSQSIRSAHSDTLAPSHPTSSRAHHASNPVASTTAAVRPSRHTRTISTSSNPSKRPVRTPTPEVLEHPAPSYDPPRRAREEPRRVPTKLDMPPPDYIPTRGPDSGPQRPLSATDLHFPHHGFAPERAPSGPQRVALGDGMSGAAPMRSGPIRPAILPVKPASGSGVGDGTEKKERVVGGARRVLRLPETTAPAPTAAEEKTAVASGPIRPRVISTSRSTPAVPLRAAAATVKEREEALKAKKLASSQGASGKAPGSVAATTAAAAAKHARTNSGGVQSMTASARARAAERAQEKAAAAAAKPTSRAAPSSKMSVSSSRTGPSTTVTVRDRNRAASGSKVGAVPAKASAKDAKAGGRSRAGTQEPPSRAQSVAPVEVPLPESPKATAEALPSEETEEQELAVPDPTGAAVSEEAVPPNSQEQTPLPVEIESVALIDFSSPFPTPATVPLPSSGPASPAEESPFSLATPENDTTIPAPSTDPSPSILPVSSTPASPPSLLVPAIAHEAHTPEQPRTRRAEVEQTPISALVASIERGFFAMRGAPLSPMREEEDECSMVIPAVEEPGVGDADARVFDAVPVKPLFVRRNRGALHA